MNRSSWILMLALTGTAVVARSEHAPAFNLSSPQFTSGASLELAQVFNAMGCSGKNQSPELHWTESPAGTVAFALTVYDPDAPTGSGWWHWMVVNLDASLRSLPQDAGQLRKHRLPPGAITIRNDAGEIAYSGPCPPVGSPPHRYYFKLYALKSRIEAKPTTPAAQVGFQIHQAQIGMAELLGQYAR